MKIFTTLVFYFCFGLLHSQNPSWHSKFVVKHPSGITDTIWFGLDVNAAEGFQTGIDSLDTNLVHPISILAQDELVRQEFNTPYCGNLKRDYKDFKSGMIEFDFYLKSDSFPGDIDPNPVEIYWDTVDFAYNSQNYEIKVVKLISSGGHIQAIDNHEWFVYYNTMPYTSDTIVKLMFEQSPAICNSNDKIISLKLEVWINTYVGIEKNKNNTFFSIGPNPNSGLFKIIFYEKYTGLISIIDFSGKRIHSENIINKNSLDILLKVSPGVYFLQLFSENKENSTVEKIIIY